MALPSIDAFVELVVKSGVVESARLTDYLERLRSAGLVPAEPGQLAAAMVRDGVLSQFQAEQLLAGRWRGFFVGKYKVLERLGAGGMGTVYLGEHKLMKRRVALKVLPRSRASDPAALDRFRREAVAVAALNHPNIVRAYDHDQDGDLHFLVMEYVDGISLHDLVRLHGPLEVHRACHYILQAARGLEHAHGVGMVHRDIKPGNLLVDRNGVVKLLDMGLARFFNEEGESLTKKYDESVLGTADYLAPEQALDSHGVDIRADIYSLGGTFYYLLTGKSPFGEGTIAQKLIWHQTRRPRPLRELRPEVPEAVLGVVEKMMAKAPEDRYATPTEVVQALLPLAGDPPPLLPDHYLPNLSPAARVPPTDGPPPPQLAPSPGLSVATAATAVTVLRPPPPHPSAVSLAETAVAPNAAATADASQSSEDFSWDTLATRPIAEPLVRKPRQGREPASVVKPGTPWCWPPSRWLWTGAAAALLVIVVAIFVVKSLLDGGNPPQDTRPGEESTAWFVSAQEGDEPSIAAALKKARPGDRIVIRKGTVLREAIALDSNTVKLKAIEAEDADVTIIPPEDHPADKPLASFRNVQLLALRGLRLDGQSRCHNAILIHGKCPGLKLEKIVVQGYGQCGVRFTNAGGMAQSGDLLRMTGVRLEAATGKEGPPLSGFEFDAVGECIQVRLEECFVNGPHAAQVRIKGSLRHVLFEKCEFRGGGGYAVLYPIEAAEHCERLHAQFRHCTFDGFRRGFGWEASRIPQDLRLTLDDNTFGNIEEAAWFGPFPPSDFIGMIVGKGNFYDEKTCNPERFAELARESESPERKLPPDARFQFQRK